tara:strand:+ start:3807 stop:4163 length:357 start_codon:yes stop_codon:yes gene_type:complete
MAKRPKNRKVDRSMTDQGGVTPIRALTVALMNRRDRKEDRKYQKSLEDMGMFEEGGGRANVDRDFRGSMPLKERKNFKGNQLSAYNLLEKKISKKAAGGKLSRGDGLCVRGKTKGRMV